MSNTAQNQVEKKEKASELQVVLGLIKTSIENGELQLPANYSYINALKSAWLVLGETVDKDKRLVLESCSRSSIIQSLVKMVTKAMSVVKGQCYFIAYNGVLKCEESYHIKVATAKRHGVAKVVTNAIYENDVFEFEIDAETGVKRIIKHTQNLESIGTGQNIRGAYAVVHFEDGRKELTVMTKAQIVMAWNQRQGNGLSKAHENFTDEMACKTVSNRAMKPIIGSSDDSDLVDVNQPTNQKPEIPKTANSEAFTFDDHEEVKETPKAIESKPVINIPAKEKVLEEVGANGELFEGAAKKDPF